MKVAIDRLQSIQRYMRINLARRNIGMAQDRLHCPKISAVFYHVGGAAMAQHVRTGMAY
jgi:hypothetical protein